MATKQLSVLIKAVDQFTAPLRTMIGGVGAFGQGILSMAAKAGGSILSLIKHFTSLTGIVQGLIVGKVIGGIASAFGEAVQEINQIGDIGRTFEIPVEQLARLRVVARAAGGDLAGLAGILDKAQGALGEAAATGKGAAAEALTRLRIPLRDSAGNVRNIVDLLPELAIQMERLPDNAQRLNALGGIFGKADDDVLKILNLGAERIALLQQQAGAFADIFTPETVASAQRYRQAVQGVQDAWLTLKVRLFGEIGPFIADFFESAAVVIGNLPELIGSVLGTTRDAIFGSGEQQAQARQQFADFFESITRLAEAGINNMGRVLLGVSLVTSRAYFSVFRENLISEYRKIQDEVAVGFALFGEELGVFPKGTAQTQFENNLASARSKFDAFNAQLSDSGEYTDELRIAWTKMRTEVSAAGIDVLRTGNAIVDVSGLLNSGSDATRRVFEAVQALRRVTEQPLAVTGGGFLDGMRAAAEDLAIQTGNLFEQGKQVYSGIAQQISGNLSNALVDAASSVRTLGGAFRDFLSSTLRGVSQLITQMLVLRAVSGIGATIFGTAASAGTLAPAVLEGGGVPGVAVASTVDVGSIGKPPVPGFGGFASGGGGGGGVGGAGGASVQVSIVVNVNGGGGGAGGAIDARSVAAIKEAAMEGVMQGLERSAAQRDRLRRLLV